MKKNLIFFFFFFFLISYLFVRDIERAAEHERRDWQRERSRLPAEQGARSQDTGIMT